MSATIGTKTGTPVLEPTARAFADATARPPYVLALPVPGGRTAVDQ
jgi:hypothetical protein